MTSTAAGEQFPLRQRLVVFIGLVLAVSISWPSPMQLAGVSVQPDWFLGHEPWILDAIFWINAVAAVTLLLFSTRMARGPRLAAGDALRSSALPVGALRLAAVALLAGMALTALTWFFLDEPVVSTVPGGLRATLIFPLLNRLSGGANPVLLALLLIVFGFFYRLPGWLRTGAVMAATAVITGLVVQVVKTLVDRSRPEAGFGAFHFEASGSSSFPSGHTAVIFSIASVLAFSSRRKSTAILLFLLAAAAGAARIVSLRHWPSDVVASAILATVAGWLMTKRWKSGGLS